MTKKFIDSIKPPEKGEAIYWDDELKGFAVRVWPSGTKAYLIHYRTRSGRQRKMSLGRHGVLTPAEARSRAVRFLGEIAGGGDPMGQREKGRKEQRRDRVLTDHEIEILWTELPKTDVSPLTQAALMLILITIQRPGIESSYLRRRSGYWRGSIRVGYT